MGTESELLIVYSRGRIYRFKVVGRYSHTRFGGPHSVKITGASYGPAALHQFAIIHPTALSALMDGSFLLPLIYGMQFDECEILYKIDIAGDVEIHQIKPNRSTPDWPYPNYPAHLPYFSLEPTSSRCSWKNFRKLFPSFEDTAEPDVIAIAPPQFSTGFSLWGPMGDAEGVSIVWEVNAAEKLVRAYNICT